MKFIARSLDTLSPTPSVSPPVWTSTLMSLIRCSTSVPLSWRSAAPPLCRRKETPNLECSDCPLNTP